MSTQPKRFAIMASGSGSNAQVLFDKVKDGTIPAEIACLFCDKPGAKVIERAEAAGIETVVFSPKEFESKEAYESAIVREFRQRGVEHVVLAGYMRLCGSAFLSAYAGKTINLHPSLLPLFPGKDAIGDALAAGVKYTGVTVHFIDEGMDTGPIIRQETVRIDPADTRETLAPKIHAAEHRLLPEVTAQLVSGKLAFENGGNEYMKRALISVSDKTGIIELAEALVRHDIEVVSTGGTHKLLAEAGVPVTNISDITGFPEIMDGRVKTLHPNIHGGLLAIRSNQEHMAAIEGLNIKPIDYVIVNLYPFQATIEKPDVTFEDAIENIDIGGPSMLRAAAKNYQDVAVVVDSADYARLIDALDNNNPLTRDEKLALATKVFRHTAAYDALISQYLSKVTGNDYPERMTLTFEKVQDLRYGENPHQTAAFYAEPGAAQHTIAGAKQLHGKALSYNNIMDANAALSIVQEFAEPAVVAVKHTNPCGVGVAETIVDAYQKAYESDPVSIFGGIIALNREVDEATATKMSELFLEIILAPSFTEAAFEILAKKKNIRLMTVSMTPEAGIAALGAPRTALKVQGGLLVQDLDTRQLTDEDLTVATKRQPTEEELKQLLFAWKVVKHVKSNAIVLAREDRTVGVGAGQMNRVGAAKIAFEQAGELAKGSVLASDAFFPMGDTVQAAAAAGITAIIQPGGSIKDAESIAAADEAGIAMIFTGVRHFKH